MAQAGITAAFDQPGAAGNEAGKALVAGAAATAVTCAIAGVPAGAGENFAQLSGRTIVNREYGDIAIRNATRVPFESGYFDVIGHGTPSELGGLSPSELAEQLRADERWAGQDVCLLSCSTGAGGCSYAQQLADELGVHVKAPTTDIYVNSRGVIRFDPGGTWHIFGPSGG